MTFVSFLELDGAAVSVASDAAALIETTDSGGVGVDACAVYVRNMVAFPSSAGVEITVQGTLAAVALALDPNYGTPAAIYKSLPLVDGSTVVVLPGIVRVIQAVPGEPAQSRAWVAAVNPISAPRVLRVALSPAATIAALA